MGDVLSLVEKAESAIKEDEAEALTQRLLAAKFDFNDFLKQYKMVTGMGSMGAIMKMLPGALGRMRLRTLQGGLSCHFTYENGKTCLSSVTRCLAWTA